MRRFAIALLFVLALGACAGSQRVAVDAGGDSLTRDQLVALTTALQPPGDEREGAVSSLNLRTIASAHLVSTALLEYLDDTGQPVPEDLRGMAQDFVTDQIGTQEIRPIEFGSVEFEAYVEILMAQELLARLPMEEGEFLEIISEYSEDYEVESRIGFWDSSTGTIIAS